MEQVLDDVQWVRKDVSITKADGTLVFGMKGVEFPANWSQTACDICASKYFRKSGVPVGGVANFDGEIDAQQVRGPETSLRQVIVRMVKCWSRWGRMLGYFNGVSCADIFEVEVAFILVHQMASPNSPQWFNTGIGSEYGITGDPQGHWIADFKTGEVKQSPDAYTHPQPHACFIQKVEDDLVNDGGIMDLWTREARLFKYGSGTGTNFSAIRAKGEPLGNGGVSSGLMPFLKIGDAAGGCIQSGGTTRKAAKMVCLDIDHPEILDFIRWKRREEMKVKCLVEGFKSLTNSDENFHKESHDAGLFLDYDFNGEAYRTVSGQNSNNSVRISDAFMGSLSANEKWELKGRVDGKKTVVESRHIWDELCKAAWECADPGVQFDTTINAWNTCPNSGRINASNPCSEYMFLDNTACNLASINLLKFFGTDCFNVRGFIYCAEIMTIVLDISVSMAQFPSKEVAQESWKYRTLGLGYANLGALLMCACIPYESDEARQFAGLITSILTASSYRTSTRLARSFGPFPGYQKNRDACLGVLDRHRDFNRRLNRDKIPSRISNWEELYKASKYAWEETNGFASQFGIRNAQVSCIAPTGTIGLVMDCDTTGIEPDFSLVKYKKMSDGGYVKIINQSVSRCLERLGYTKDQIVYVLTNLTVSSPRDSGIKEEHLSIFSCAAGENPISIAGHIRMMAAVQPFVSGAISKTINMPHESSVDDVSQAYKMAWELGLKACALYRDGCKHSQPLNTKKAEKEERLKKAVQETSKLLGLKIHPGSVTQDQIDDRKASINPGVYRTELEGSWVPQRKKLPKTRKCVTHKFKVGDHSGYLTLGFFENGSPGEVFIRINKSGSTVHGLFESFGRAVSLALQYGAPMDVVVESFSRQRFEPSGITDDKDIPIASSIVDYVFRWIGHYLSSMTASPGASERDHTGVTSGDVVPPVPGPSEIAARTQRDAPACGECGGLMVRSGACYKCDNCGAQGGCG